MQSTYIYTSVRLLHSLSYHQHQKSSFLVRTTTTFAPSQPHPSTFAMDRKTRQQYPQFVYDWVNLGYGDFPQPPNLTANIHPILRAKAFFGTKAEYEMIKPALQLATNYLYSPNSCSFIYSLVFGERKSVPSRFNIGGQTFKANGKEFKVGGRASVEFKEAEDFSVEKMDRIWQKLALHIRFGAEDMVGKDAYCGSTVSRFLGIFFCERVRLTPICTQGKDGADLLDYGCHGAATKIAFHKNYLDDITTLNSAGKTLSLEMLNVQFSLAVVLCHEIGHAVNWARDVSTFISGRSLPLLVTTGIMSVQRCTKTCLSFRDSSSGYMQASQESNADSEMYLVGAPPRGGLTARQQAAVPSLYFGAFLRGKYIPCRFTSLLVITRHHASVGEQRTRHVRPAPNNIPTEKCRLRNLSRNK